MSRPAILVPVLATALLLSACTDDEPEISQPTSTSTPRILQGAAPGEANSTLTAMPEVEPPEITEADVAFVHMMLPHHAQALEMTALVADRTSRDDVPLFAERIELSQQDEIGLMVRWLEDRDLPVPQGFGSEAGHDGHADTGGGHDHGHGGALMPGMLTAEQLEQLEAAEGEEFDRLFLELMYYHHDGALQMVEDLQAGGGSQDSELFQLVTHIDADQRIEMDRIQQMLADMGALPATGN